MAICFICKNEITEPGRYHESVCSPKCAGIRREKVKKEQRKKRSKRYKKNNPGYGSARRWTIAAFIWKTKDNRNGNSWTQVFGER